MMMNATAGHTVAPAPTTPAPKRRRGGVVHAGHPVDARVTFVVPAADVTYHPPTSPSENGADHAGSKAMRPKALLCPTCLPAADPARRDVCAAGNPCPHLHAVMDRADRVTAHRRDDVDGVRFPCTAAVPVCGPNSRAVLEHVRPSDCLKTGADFGPMAHDDDHAATASNESVASKSDSDALLASRDTDRGMMVDSVRTEAHRHSPATAATGTPHTPELLAPKQGPPSHCAHWLLRGACAYGAACRFVHCLTPSEAALAAAQPPPKPPAHSSDDPATSGSSGNGTPEKRVPAAPLPDVSVSARRSQNAAAVDPHITPFQTPHSARAPMPVNTSTTTGTSSWAHPQPSFDAPPQQQQQQHVASYQQQQQAQLLFQQQQQQAQLYQQMLAAAAWQQLQMQQQFAAAAAAQQMQQSQSPPSHPWPPMMGSWLQSQQSQYQQQQQQQQQPFAPGQQFFPPGAPFSPVAAA